MKTASYFRKIARDRLVGHWGIAVLVCFVASVLGSQISQNVATMTIEVGDVTYELPWFFNWFWNSPVDLIRNTPVFLQVLFTWNLFVFLVGSAVELGLCLFNIRLCRGESVQFATLFERFSIFLKALGLRLYMGLFIFLWSLLFVIPGIVASYRYAMAPYLMAEHPEMGIVEAVNQSKWLMDGHKGRLFCLQFSFLGWYILGSLLFGIGLLFVVPYVNTAIAAFYLDRTGGFYSNDSDDHDQPEYI